MLAVLPCSVWDPHMGAGRDTAGRVHILRAACRAFNSCTAQLFSVRPVPAETSLRGSAVLLRSRLQGPLCVSQLFTSAHACRDLEEQDDDDEAYREMDELSGALGVLGRRAG